MTLIQKILVGVDLHHGDRFAAREISEESQAAVAEAIDVAAVSGSAITFCSVLEISARSQSLVGPSLVELDHETICQSVKTIAHELLIRLVNQAVANGLIADCVVRIGVAAEELLKASVEGQYDLLMIGMRSKQRASTHLFGNTAIQLMRHSPSPVWVVKPAEIRVIRDVAIATDLSPAALPAFHLAVTIARVIQARLHVLHAVGLTDLRYLAIAGMTEPALAQLEEHLRKSADDQVRDQLHQTDFRTLPHGVKIEHLNGAADVAITQFIADQEIDLLVIGTHGRTGITGLFLGNTAERILPALQASLLAVKPAQFSLPHSH